MKIAELRSAFPDLARAIGEEAFERLAGLILAGAVLVVDIDGDMGRGRDGEMGIDAATWAAAAAARDIFLITRKSRDAVKEPFSQSGFAGLICECNLEFVMPDGSAFLLEDLDDSELPQTSIAEYLAHFGRNLSLARTIGGFVVNLAGARDWQVGSISTFVHSLARFHGRRVLYTDRMIELALPEDRQNKGLGLDVVRNFLLARANGPIGLETLRGDPHEGPQLPLICLALGDSVDEDIVFSADVTISSSRQDAFVVQLDGPARFKDILGMVTFAM